MFNLLQQENFIRVREDCYLINLNLFLGAEDFNISLLEFLGEHCRAKKRYSKHSECDIYLLEFNDSQFSKKNVKLFHFYTYM